MTTATTYRAWELTGFSMKEKLVTASKREEQKLEPHQIKIKVKACSLNFRDILMARGHYNPKMPLPVVMLSDGAGEVVEVGSAVTKFKKGDRVCIYLPMVPEVVVAMLACARIGAIHAVVFAGFSAAALAGSAAEAATGAEAAGGSCACSGPARPNPPPPGRW